MTKDEIEKLDGSELAAAVAEQVMGWLPSATSLEMDEVDSWWKPEDDSTILLGDWRPDLNIAQAFEAIAHVVMHTNWEDFSYVWYQIARHRATFRAHRWGESKWPPADAVDGNGNYYVSIEAETAARAFSRCTLLAVQEPSCPE